MRVVVLLMALGLNLVDMRWVGQWPRQVIEITRETGASLISEWLEVLRWY